MKTISRCIRKRRERIAPQAAVPSIRSLPKGQDTIEKEHAGDGDWKRHIRRYQERAITLKELYELLRELWGLEVFEWTRTSWENMKQRCKGGYAELDPRLESLPSFALHIGPRTFKSDSLERVDNRLGYSPDNCIWAGKTDQANNRRNTVYLQDRDGIRLPQTEWARRLGVSPGTLRSRRAAGWSDLEIIHGRSTSSYDEYARCDWPPDLEEEWEQDFKLTGGTTNRHRLLFMIYRTKIMLGHLFDEAECLSDRLMPNHPDELIDDSDHPKYEARLKEVNAEIDFIDDYRGRAVKELKRVRLEQESREAWKQRYRDLYGEGATPPLH